MRIGFLSLPVSGHMNPMTTRARRLQSRGNDVVFIAVPDAEPVVRAAKLPFVPFCEKEFPLGSVAKAWSPVAKMQGEDVLRHSAKHAARELCAAAFEHLPKAIAEAGVDALVIDWTYFYLELVAIELGIPYVHVFNVLHFDHSGATPPFLFGWPHETTPEAVARNIEGLASAFAIIAPAAEAGKAYAEKTNMTIDWNDPSATLSKLAIISQTPREFDFPNIDWPAQFHYTGPFHDDDGRKEIPFPWEKLTGEPLIYSSMGTLVNGLEHVYRTILDAAKTLTGVQFVLSVGHNINSSDLGPIPSNTVVVNSAPQLSLLKRASLCITHAGLNTTLESLANGVPMVAIPVGYEQPGIAARIAYHGVGETVALEQLTVENLANKIQRVRTNSSYYDKARFMQKAIARTRGLDQAAELIENAFSTSETVDAERFELSHA
jgi:zeaxanthin glucosyltransferase